MKSIKAILIDDEQSARNILTNLLNRTSANITIVATCSNLEEGVVQIKKLQPNVVFLDVQMPNYAGYEITRFFNTINFKIIFVTAYDEYAIKAFELNAIDYLVKPIDRKKLALTIKKLEEQLQKEKVFMDYQSLLKRVQDKDFKKIVLPELNNKRVINVDDIVAVEANGAYSTIHLKESKTITVSKNLKYFENALHMHPVFFRSHRAWIINLDYIEFLNKTTQNVILANKTVVAKISRARIEDFEKVF